MQVERHWEQGRGNENDVRQVNQTGEEQMSTSVKQNTGNTAGRKYKVTARPKTSQVTTNQNPKPRK